MSGCLGAPASGARPPEAGQRVGRRPEPAAACRGYCCRPIRMRVRRRKRRRGERLRLPAGRRCASSRWLPRRVVTFQPRRSAREPADVLVREQRERRVGRALGRRADRVADGGPVRAVVGGDLEAVGGGDHGRVAPDDDAAGDHVLPLRARAARRSSSARSGRRRSRAPSRCPPCRTRSRPAGRRRCLHEVHRDRRRRRVVADRLPGRGARRETEDPLAVGADPERALGIARHGEHVDAPAGAVGQRRAGAGGAAWAGQPAGEARGSASRRGAAGEVRIDESGRR